MSINIALAPASDDDPASTAPPAPETPPRAAVDPPPEAAYEQEILPPGGALSDRLMRFVREYVIDNDGTAAAARAGFPRRNAAHWSAAALRKPAVQEAIRQEREARAGAARVSPQRLIVEAARIAFADPGRIARWTPEGITLMHSEDLTDDDRAAVKRITLGASGGKGAPKRAQLFEMHDKVAALELLARLTGLLPRGKHPPALDDPQARRDAKAELRARLQRIMRGEEK
ncbi:MAG TPA: terminase small subunit [Stellaceae bacterium]|jgi:phage terminase small subunit